jgi:glutamate/tyrosine decarboxylase-like PLP-dependent enzyme
MSHCVDLARAAARLIERDPALELVVEPQTVNVCFRVKGIDSARLCNYLDRHRILKIGHGTIGSNSAIRLVCVNPDLDHERIADVLEEIKAAARSMTG